MAFKVTQSGVLQRLIDHQSFMCNSLVGESFCAGAVYQVKSYDQVIGWVINGQHYINSTKYSTTTGKGQGWLRTAWGQYGYELVDHAGMDRVATLDFRAGAR